MRFIHRLGGPCCPVPNKKQNQQSEEDIPSDPNTNNYEYVDLGLPSRTLWATMNVGAINETDYGLYFQWGDTEGYTAEQVGSGEGKKHFGWADYKWSENGSSSVFTKYNATDGKTVLDLEDDAARANWGGSWKMPTTEQFQELINTDYCTSTVTIIDGVKGCLFTSVTNGNTLFFPTAGSAINNNVSGIDYYGCIWSSSLYSSDVESGRCLTISGAGIVNNSYRCYGQSVRGVIG